MKPIVLYFGLAALAGVGLFSLVLLFRSPSHDRAWAPEHARLPEVRIEGDIATVRNLRNFRYDADGGITDPVYEDRRYDLSELTSVWYGVTQISSFKGVAHTFLSFGFADGSYLAISIEARREIGESYGPFRGLFRKYEVIFVIGDERDIIGLRSHIQKNPVRLYPIRVSPGEGAELLRAMLAEADEINRTPRFYNTLIDNCTTGIVKYATPMPAWRRLLDYRIVLPGYSDRLVAELGLLEPGVSVAEATARAAIDPARTPLESGDFSALFRREMHP
jgi:hypothetical protein